MRDQITRISVDTQIHIDVDASVTRFDDEKSLDPWVLTYYDCVNTDYTSRG